VVLIGAAEAGAVVMFRATADLGPNDSGVFSMTRVK
jgi:hypothetical protein